MVITATEKKSEGKGNRKFCHEMHKVNRVDKECFLEKVIFVQGSERYERMIY